MTYSEFERALLVAIVAAADLNDRGQVDVIAAAHSALADVAEKWIYSAVRSYEDDRLIYNVSKGINPPSITVMVTGDGRRRAESLA
jgi:hypothetical protein